MGIEKFVGFSPKIYAHPWFINDWNEDMHSVERDYYGAPKKLKKQKSLNIKSIMESTLKEG